MDTSRHAAHFIAAGEWLATLQSGTVTLIYADRCRRRVRLLDDAGAPFLLDLMRPARLADGDGLVLADGTIIRVVARAGAVGRGYRHRRAASGAPGLACRQPACGGRDRRQIGGCASRMIPCCRRCCAASAPRPAPSPRRSIPRAAPMPRWRRGITMDTIDRTMSRERCGRAAADLAVARFSGRRVQLFPWAGICGRGRPGQRSRDADCVDRRDSCVTAPGGWTACCCWRRTVPPQSRRSRSIDRRSQSWRPRCAAAPSWRSNPPRKVPRS